MDYSCLTICFLVLSHQVLAREEITVDQLVDVVQGNREYKPCLYLYNKIDTITIEEIDQLARMPHSMVGSVQQHFNIGDPDDDDMLKQKLWEYLGLTRIYTKRKGELCDTTHSSWIDYFLSPTHQHLFPHQDPHPTWKNPSFYPKSARAPKSSRSVPIFRRNSCAISITHSFGEPAPSTPRSDVD